MLTVLGSLCLWCHVRVVWCTAIWARIILCVNAYATHGVVLLKNMSTHHPPFPFEWRPKRVQRDTWPYWRLMHPCRCLLGEHYCENLSVSFYGYRCRQCNVYIDRDWTPICLCDCAGCANRNSVVPSSLATAFLGRTVVITRAAGR